MQQELDFDGVKTVVEPEAPVYLRDYQVDIANRLGAAESRGVKKLLLQAATGAGKTVIASAIIEAAAANGKSVLFLAHRRELIFQAVNKLRDFGLNPGVIMAGVERDYGNPIQVGSIQTIWSRAIRRQKMDLPPADLLFIDEAHRSLSETYMKIIALYPNSILLGLTATPIRGDGRGLGNVYEHMECCPHIGELTEMGYLVPVKYFVPTKPDLEGVRITAGDYNEKDLAQRMDKPELVGDVVENWARIAPGRQTIVFASGVQHSMHIRDEFRKAGVKAEHIDGSTEHGERARILKALHDGDVTVVSNCAVLTEGFDSPPVSCIVLARPTRSPGLYIQTAGRGLRPYPGKENCILIDHSGAVLDHGMLSEFTDWELDSKLPIRKQVEARKAEKGTGIECRNCKAFYFGQRRCPECGHEPKRFPKGVAYRDGMLYEIGTMPNEKFTKEDKQQWYAELKHYAEDRGYKQGWVSHTYKDKFGVWPKGVNGLAAQPAGLAVRAFIAKKLKNYQHRVKGS